MTPPAVLSVQGTGVGDEQMSERDSWTTPDGWSTPAGWGGPANPSQPPGPNGPTGPPSPESPGAAAGYGQESAPGYGPGAGPGGPGYGPVPPANGTWGARPSELKPGVVPLRPLGLGEVLDGAVSVIRRYPRPALGLSAVVALVTTVLNVLLLVTAFQPFLALDPTALENGDTAALEGALGGAFAGGALTVVLTLLSGAVLTGAITAVVGRAVLGAPLSFGDAWTQVRPTLLKLVGLALLVLAMVYGIVIVGLVVGVGIIAVGGPLLALVGVPLILASLALALHLYIRFALAPCVLVLERSGIRDALRRSGVLVKSDWWRVLGILLLTFIIGGFVSQIIQLPFAVFGAGSPSNLLESDTGLGTRALVLSAIGGGIASTVVAPFTAGVRALLYVDRRMRAEGLDVALTAAANARS